MGEFSPGVLEAEFADENEDASKHIDGQESHVGQDGCRIFAPKSELVRGEEFQFTHEPETQGQQEDNGNKKGVRNHSWFLSVGKFKSLSTRLPEWHGKRALSPLATEALQKRSVCSGDDRQRRGQWFRREPESEWKDECGALSLGRARLAAPGVTRVPNRRWQSPECCQQDPINREDLLLFRRILPGRGVQRKLPSTITNGQKLVLIPRLRK